MCSIQGMESRRIGGGEFVDDTPALRFLFRSNNRAAFNNPLLVAWIGERRGGEFVGNREGDL